jgi:hypothetical protein
VKSTLVMLLVVSLALTGCISTRVIVPGADPTLARTVIHVGDRATVLLKTGKVRTLEVSAVDDQTITGREGKGSAAAIVQITLADVQSVEYRRVSGLRTAGLAAGVVVGLAASLVGAYFIVCGKNSHKCSE